MSKSISFIFFFFALSTFAPSSSVSSSSASAAPAVADLQAAQAALERQEVLQWSLDEVKVTLEKQRALQAYVDKAKVQEMKTAGPYSRLQGLLTGKDCGIDALLKNTDDKLNAKQFGAFRSNYMAVCGGIKGVAEWVKSSVVGDLCCDVNMAGAKACRSDFERMRGVIEKALKTQEPIMTAVKSRVKEAEKQMEEFRQEALDVKKAEETIHAKGREEKARKRTEERAAAAAQAKREGREHEELELQKKYSRLREHAGQFFDKEIAHKIKVIKHVTAVCKDVAHDFCVNVERIGPEWVKLLHAQVTAQDLELKRLCCDALGAAKNAYLDLFANPDIRTAIRERRGLLLGSVGRIVRGPDIYYLPKENQLASMS